MNPNTVDRILELAESACECFGWILIVALSCLPIVVALHVAATVGGN